MHLYTIKYSHAYVVSIDTGCLASCGGAQGGRPCGTAGRMNCILHGGTEIKCRRQEITKPLGWSDISGEQHRQKTNDPVVGVRAVLQL